MSKNNKRENWYEEPTTLESFNFLARHSLRNSWICSPNNSSGDFANVMLYALGAPMIMGLFKQDPYLIGSGAGIIASYIAARSVYKRVLDSKPLKGIWNSVAQVDMPVYLAGQAYASYIFTKDTIGMFTGSGDAGSSADPVILLSTLMALYAGLPNLKDIVSSHPQASEAQPLLPPPVDPSNE